MTHNIDGDAKDVWPWLGETAREAKANGGRKARFDIAKLEEWRDLFEYMQPKGVVPYLILEDDSAWKDYDHERYWREMIARFGDLPAVLFNLGEEHNENYPLAEGLEMAGRLKELDPYDHPRGIHNIRQPRDEYVDSPHVDFTAIQTGQPGRPGAVKEAVEHNQIAVEWIERCRDCGRRVLVVNFDEGRPELDRRAYWSAYLGGGVWEAHVTEPFDAPPSGWEPLWAELGGARAFMESLPFWEMEPTGEAGAGVLSGEAGRGLRSVPSVRRHGHGGTPGRGDLRGRLVEPGQRPQRRFPTARGGWRGPATLKRARFRRLGAANRAHRKIIAEARA